MRNDGAGHVLLEGMHADMKKHIARHMHDAMMQMLIKEYTKVQRVAIT